MRVSNINLTILEQTIQGLDQAILSKFPKMGEWLEGSRQPTFKQLADYAKAVDIPFGYFFLETLPEQTASIPHYRTTVDKTVVPSKDLQAVIALVEERQAWAKDLLLEWGAETLPFAGQYSIHSPVEAVVQAVYRVLGINEVEWASKFVTWQHAFKHLIIQAEAARIFVIVNGIVGNNTRRSLQVEEFRGFVLYDEIAPFVFINGKDAVAGKIFTLIHEIVHVLIGESASFDWSFDKAHSNSIERFCNQVAAQFLVPDVLIKQFVEKYDYQAVYNKLARACKVSEVVVARRLLDTGRINKAQFFSFYKAHQNRVVALKQGSGGDFYKSVPYRVSQRFFDLINTAMLQNSIQPTDAFRLTGLKAKTYDAYLSKLKE